MLIVSLMTVLTVVKVLSFYICHVNVFFCIYVAFVTEVGTT